MLCALAISVRPDRQGQRLSSRMLDEMRRAAGSHGLRELIAPVRPTRKSLYPLIPIERYVEWRREDGSHFDPWIRLHERVGGTPARPVPGVDDDGGARLRLGGVDGHGVPRRRRPRLPGRARAAPRARRSRPATSSRTSGSGTSRYAGRRTTPSLVATSPSRSSEATASASRLSAARGSAATRRSVSARRWRNEPSNGPCLRSGS